MARATGTILGGLPWALALLAGVTAAVSTVWAIRGESEKSRHLAELERLRSLRTAAETRTRNESECSHCVSPEQARRLIQRLCPRPDVSATHRAPPTEAASAASGSPEQPSSRSMQEAYLAAVQRDQQKYSPEELAEIEDLYQQGNDAIESAAGEERLRTLIERYPDSNRAGCASMNLGAVYLNGGLLEEAQQHLEMLVEQQNSAVFESGEAVLPKALLNLAMLHHERGESRAALDAWRRVLTEHPEARDAQGVAYARLVEEQTLRRGYAADALQE